MKMCCLSVLIVSFLLSGCSSDEMKRKKSIKHLSSLTCESSKEGRTQEELKAIGSACFKRGSYGKSHGIKW